MQSIPLVLALATPLVLAASPPEASPLPDAKSAVPSLRTADPNCPPPARVEAPSRVEVPSDAGTWNGMPGPGVAPTTRPPVPVRSSEMSGNARMQSGNGIMWGYNVGPWNGPPPGPGNQNQPGNQEEGGPAGDGRFGGGPAMGGQNMGGGMGYGAPWGGQGGFNNRMPPGQPEETNTPPPGYGQWSGPARTGYDIPPPATPFAPIEERLINIERRLDELMQRLSSPPK
ncbi:exported hypothetical protein [Gammaproteobacteria bacterium]